MHAQDSTISHVPPADGLLRPLAILVEGAVDSVDVATVGVAGRVCREPEVVVVVLMWVRHDNRLGVVAIGHGAVEADLAALGVVDSADLEAVLVATDEARVAAAVTRRARGHDAGLCKDARAAIVATRECDRVLIVVREVEVAGEPALDRWIVAHDLDELLRGVAVIVVEPAASVHHVALLKDAKARADDRRVREAEDAPALLGGVVLDGLLEPLELWHVHEHLM
mmetsp:Transcript_21564/g.46422  ORF Transcript_21564/g.46422 Transcript_21564/m.46422 type:complete len:225 (-) Transcript_21564:568-1242(-)